MDLGKGQRWAVWKPDPRSRGWWTSELTGCFLSLTYKKDFRQKRLITFIFFFCHPCNNWQENPNDLMIWDVAHGLCCMILVGFLMMGCSPGERHGTDADSRHLGHWCQGDLIQEPWKRALSCCSWAPHWVQRVGRHIASFLIKNLQTHYYFCFGCI